MDDTCAVCADVLEWVAYGACGHKDVCSTCVARLRFICDDSRCCICKTKSDFVFVTKALGDYTHMVSDFLALPSQPKEGRVGSYWYHEDTKAFFDDADHYKMIKAMCKLSCSVCDRADNEPNVNDGSRRRTRTRFRNIEQLKGHLFHQHRLHMCSLCLEGRKVFICEQKLYTQRQRNQHISTGDSEVDGSESERGGFMGHPKCEFCQNPFYGDNELYSHMSTEHFTCHICQRQHPGQYEYYKDYNDLEIHFGKDHFLCEEEACLAKKFIVFQYEAELKRHNTLEHGGRMSRSKRNAVLQLPTSFRYRRGNIPEGRRGRGRTFQRDTSENDLSMAIQVSLEASNLDGRLPDSSPSRTRLPSVSGELREDDPLIPPFEPLATTDNELSSRYREALSQNSRNSSLGESSFPPLPMAPGGSQLKPLQDGSLNNTMAARIRRKNNVKVLNASSSSLAGPVGSRAAVPVAISPQHALPASSSWSGLASTSAQMKLQRSSSNLSNSVQDQPALMPDGQHVWPTLNSSSMLASTSGQSKLASENGPSLSSYSSYLQARPAVINESSSSSVSSSKNWGNSARVSHSASAPNLVDSGSFDSLATDFPPVSAGQAPKLLPANKVTASVKDIHSANNSLVEQIHFALGFDKDKFSYFKDISAEYRRGSIDAETYLAFAEQFGLSHLVDELARLCPDVQKQKELIETYECKMVFDTPRESRRNDASNLKNANGLRKGKEKADDARSNTSKDKLADSIISTVRKLESSYKPGENGVEVLSKDGYRGTKGKSKVMVDQTQAKLSLSDKPTNLKDKNGLLAVGESNQRGGENDGRNKPRKKTSKFHRIRLGDGSAEAILGLKNPNSDLDPDPDLNEAQSTLQNHPSEGLPARGVWRNGGGQKLFGNDFKEGQRNK